MKYIRVFSWLAALVLVGPVHAQSLLPDPVAEFPEPDMERVKLGQLLFYDPILSGSRTVSCATCHHPDFGTSDGLSLGLGDGGIGLGPKRRVDEKNVPEQRVPRNSPGLFNLGASEFTVFFHDGRLETDPRKPNGIRTPLGEDMVTGFQSALSAQAMFPVLSPDEMAGHYSESDVSIAVRSGQLTHDGGAWDIIAKRVSDISEYNQMFKSVLGDGREVDFTDIANVIADFIAFEWRADNSPFDVMLRDHVALPFGAKQGMYLFYGRAGCSTCHAGLFQTDHGFHAIAMPQIGPGKAARFEDHQRDEGRMRVTGNPDDAYRFRTPSLRNVALTAPYGHAGAYATLEAVIRHHLNPVGSLNVYDREQALLPDLDGASDWAVLEDPKSLDPIVSANELRRNSLSDGEINALIAFLNALTDPISKTGRLGVPDTVPSGLEVE